MASGMKIASAYVEIGADLAKVDAGMNQLEPKVTKKILDLQRKTQAQLARNRLEMKVAINAGDMKGYDQLVRWNEKLAMTMERVNVAARNQAAALKQPAMPGGGRAPGGGAAGRGAVGGGGGSGAMGLMMLSQTIDDAQYGFRAIVNNIPMLSMALGQAVGMSDQLALKFGAIAGIAAVAINLIISHWDQLFEKFGYGTDTMKMIWQSAFGEVKDVAVTQLEIIEARIKELEAKPIKMAVDMFELEQAKEKLKDLKEAQQAWENMGKGKNPLEQKAAGRVAGAFGNLGQDELDALRDKMVAQRATAASKGSQAKEMTEAEKEAIRKNIRGGASMNRGQAGGFAIDTKGMENQAIETEQKRRRDAAMKVFEANKAQAADDLGAMLRDAGHSPAAQKGLVDALIGAGRGDLATKVRAAGMGPNLEPEEMARRQQSAKETKEFDLNAAKVYEAQHEKESERVAGSMMGGKINRDLLQQGGAMSDAVLQGKIADAMKRAGMSADEIGELLPRVARKLREKTDKAVEARALDRGTGEAAAREHLVKEANEAMKRDRMKDTGPKAEVMTDASYFSKLLTAGLNRTGGDDPKVIAKDQLAEAKTANKNLVELKKAFEKQHPNKGVSTFAAGRARS
jgi:hypothetical protein